MLLLLLCERSDDLQRREWVLPVLYGGLDDRADGGVVLRPALRTKATADLEFGFCRPQRLFGVVVGRRNVRIRQKGEDVIPVFGNALLEFVQLRSSRLVSLVYRRPCEQFVQPSFEVFCKHARKYVVI